MDQEFPGLKIPSRIACVTTVKVPSNSVYPPISPLTCLAPAWFGGTKLGLSQLQRLILKLYCCDYMSCRATQDLRKRIRLDNTHTFICSTCGVPFKVLYCIVLCCILLYCIVISYYYENRRIT